MHYQSDPQKRIVIFLILTLLLSAVFWVLIWQAGGIKGSGAVFVTFLMWCPGLAALITTFAFQHNVSGLGWRFGDLRYWLLAFALPIAYGGVVYGLAWLTGLGAFSTQAVPAGQSILLTLLISGPIVFILGGVFPALGEEIGWRGLLVPQLAKLTSFTNVALVVGVIWALWHVPILLFGGYNSGRPCLVCVDLFCGARDGGQFCVCVAEAQNGQRMAVGDSARQSQLFHSRHL
jgi:membrane protease YdiL (CAAX protease family)